MKEIVKIKEYLEELYKNEANNLYEIIDQLVTKYDKSEGYRRLCEKDSMLIAYGDSISDGQASPLKCFHNFLQKKVADRISAVHLLPFYPYSSDDGFSVIDYREVNPSLGSWDDIESISKDYDLMFDAVINHISRHSDWVKRFMAGDTEYKDYFIECDANEDYSMVTRPRALPLLTELVTAKGPVRVWTTFSDDQIDLNYKEPKVFAEIMDILLMYVSRGARFIRLDAIGFLWKENGTSCMHLEETHKVIKLMRLIIEEVNNDVVLITETNTPHLENISYFGNGEDEAHMVYQFPLPPLTLYTFLKEDSSVILNWLRDIKNVSANATYFNFLASHDGIGVRPVEGLLEKEDVAMMVDHVVARGGRVSYRTMSDGSQKPYELNINYLDALCTDDMTDDQRAEKFIASQAILLSILGMPGIYIHSLLGSVNDIEGMEASGINRRINREKLNYETLMHELEDKTSLRYKVFEKYLKLLDIRGRHSAFSPFADQRVIFKNRKIFSIVRHNRETGEMIEVLINISSEPVLVIGGGRNLLTETEMVAAYTMEPYEVVWRVI